MSQSKYHVGFHDFQDSFIFSRFVFLNILSIYFTQNHHFDHSRNGCKESFSPLYHRIDRLDFLVALLFLVYGKKMIQILYLPPLVIRKFSQCIDYGIYFPDLRNEICLKMFTFLSADTARKERPIPEQVSKCTIFTAGTILDIIIPYIHRILGEYSISDKKRNFLVPDQEPGFQMEIVFVRDDNHNHTNKTRTRIEPVRKKQNSDQNRKSDEDRPLHYLKHKNNPVLMGLIDNRFFEFFRRGHGNEIKEIIYVTVLVRKRENASIFSYTDGERQ